MPEEYLREQLWKLYEKLPEELKEAIFSVETADNIGNICQRNKVPDAKVPEVARYTGRVLMGLLPPKELEAVLAKEVKLKTEVAKNVAREINRFVFFPVKEVLSQLYEIEITPPARPKGAVELAERPVPEAEEEEKPKKEDIYRETIE
jgi:hypothetical protein